MNSHKYFENYLFGLFFLVCYLGFSWTPEAFALERGLDLNLSAEREYTDNILFTADDEIEDRITTLSGGLTFHNRTERSNTDLSAQVDRLSYADQKTLDAIDRFYKGKANLVFTPRWQGGVDAGFSRDSRTDRDIEVTGLVLAAERNRLNGSTFATYQATENTDATLSYGYVSEEYDGDEFSDMISHQAGLGLQHNWSKMFANTTLKFNLNYGSYEYDKTDIQLYSGTLGFKKKVSELWTLSMSGGARYQETEINIFGTITMNDEKWGTVGDMGLHYQGEYGRFGLSGKHDITPSSGLDGTTERTSLALSLYYRVAQKSGVGLNVSYHLNKADAGKLAAKDVDNETWQISPRVRLSLIDELYLIARYQYSQVENRISNETSSRRYAVLQLEYSVTLWD